MTCTQLGLRLADARNQTDRLFGVLQPGAIYERPVPERHRLIFYLGHLETFEWNHIAVWGLNEPHFHPDFDRLFEAGIDPEPGQLPNDQPHDWPKTSEILAYRDQVRAGIDELLLRAPSDLIELAIEHRLMHAETLAYLFHNLSYDKKVPEAGKKSQAACERASAQMIQISEGSVTLGKRRDQGFGWDNEFEERTVQVDRFLIDRNKVTNGDYLGFVEQGAAPPFFWSRRDQGWCCRGMFRESPLTLDAPVYVTQAEAAAYCAWKKKALPSEPQFHRAAYGSRDGSEHWYPWGDASPSSAEGNFDFQHWDPVSVCATPEGDSEFGVAQLVGNGWEWTSTIFGPFPGFTPLPSYPGYSQNFFDGKHYVLKGGSPRTAACFLRRSFRNWFRPEYPYVYATFRCIES